MSEIFGAALMGGGSGPAFAAIGAIYPVGAVCTCSYNGQTLTAKDTSGRALFLVPSAGQWLVKATNGGQEVEDTVSITTQGQVASVTLAFFSATIVCTFPVDCTSVTCTKDSTVLSVPSGSLSSGSYTFDIPEPGDWVLYATNGMKEKTVTVTVAEEKAYSAKLTFELVLFDGGDVSEVTGGWESSGSGGSASANSKITLSVSDDTGYVKSRTLTTKNSIDLTDFSMLKASVQSANGTCSMSAGSSATKNISNSGEVSLDIKNISAKREISFSVSAWLNSTPSSNLTVTRVWLE